MTTPTTAASEIQSFGKFLTEMAYSPSALPAIANTLASILSKKIGALYRVGLGDNDGPTEFEKALSGHGYGILYVQENGRAIRFNLEDKLARGLYAGDIAITSVDFWKKFEFEPESWSDNPPTINLEVPHDTNAVALCNMIVDVYNGHFNAEISEAVRVDPSYFATVVQKELGTTNVSMQQMKDVAAKHGINIPMAAREAKAGRNVFSLGSLLSKGQKEKLVVPNTVRAAEKIAVDENISIDELFGDLADLTRLVVKGKRPSLVITGDPGTGKTFTVQQEIEKAGLKRNKDWILTKGKVSPFGIYQTLYMNRKGKLVVFDDSDDVFFTPDARNILKAALDSYGERTVSWISKSTINISGKSKTEQDEIMDQIDAEIALSPSELVKLPSEFDFQGRIIFISNLAPDRIEPAILSRSLTINIQLSAKQIFEKMEKLLPSIEPSVNLKVKKEVFNFLVNQHESSSRSTRLPSMRTLVAGIQIASSGVKSWQRLMKYT